MADSAYSVGHNPNLPSDVETQMLVGGSRDSSKPDYAPNILQPPQPGTTYTASDMQPPPQISNQSKVAPGYSSEQAEALAKPDEPLEVATAREKDTKERAIPKPISLDAPVDNGPRPQFKIHRVVTQTSKGPRTRLWYTLIYPTTDEDKIVTRLNRDLPIDIPCKGEPTAALPHPQAHPGYHIDWQERSVVAKCVDQSEVTAFCQGLEDQEI